MLPCGRRGRADGQSRVHCSPPRALPNHRCAPSGAPHTLPPPPDVLPPAHSSVTHTENEQLEEMLATADARAQGGSSEVSRLEDELARALAARTSAEAALQVGWLAGRSRACTHSRLSCGRPRQPKSLLLQPLCRPPWRQPCDPPPARVLAPCPLQHALQAKEAEAQSLREQLAAAAGKAETLEEQLAGMQEASAQLIEERKVRRLPRLLRSRGEAGRPLARAPVCLPGWCLHTRSPVRRTPGTPPPPPPACRSARGSCCSRCARRWRQ